MSPKSLQLMLASIVGCATVGVHALEIELGHFDLAPCTKVEWRNDGPFGLSSPAVKSGPQRITVRAIIDGPNLDLDSRKQRVRECAAVASSAVGIPLAAANPSASNELFRASLLRCLDERKYPDEIRLVALKTESRCKW